MKILLAIVVAGAVVAALYLLPARSAQASADAPAKSAAAESAWLTDPAVALAQAKAEGKTLLMDFTGSDWCVWCQRLDSEVFAKPEFAAYAKEKLVLLKLDFPRSVPQSAEIKARNRKLLEQYGVEGFPTIIVLDSGGSKIGELGYLPGGPSAWLAELKKITKG